MSGLELNKLFGAVLVAGLVGMITTFLAERLVVADSVGTVAHPVATAVMAGHGGDTVSGGDTAGENAPAGPEPIAPLLAAADIAKGKSLSRACAACHTFTEDGGHRVGPALWNIVNADIGGADGFSYSAALAGLEGVWDYAELNAFIANPRQYASGTKMTYAGMPSTTDRAALIAWMRTLSNEPAALPVESP